MKPHSSVPWCVRPTTLSPQDELAQEKMASDALNAIMLEKSALLEKEQV